MSSVPPSALFLHSAFRSGSTWFWSRFRKASGTCAFYEPFNEAMATLDPQNAAESRPNWSPGHPALDAPYYAEYAPLLDPDGGVRRYRRRFAYQSYFDDGPDAEQQSYLSLLIGHARQAGRLPVLGFCRSQARLPWLRRHCPGLHLVTWRNPWDQWVSYHHQTLRHRNAYFEFRAFLIASLGGCHARYRPFFADLYMPPMLTYTTPDDEGFLDFFFHASHVDHRFRIFLRVFMFDMLNALANADIVVDLDRMNAESAYRGAMTSDLRGRTGLADLAFEDCALPRHGWMEDGAYLSGLDEAMDFLDGWGGHAGNDWTDGAALADLKGRLALCRDGLAAVARASVTADEPEPGAGGLDRYTLSQVLFAVRRMVRHGGSPSDGPAHLRAVYGEDFATLCEGLAGVAGLVEDMNADPGHESLRRAAVELGRLLAGGATP